MINNSGSLWLWPEAGQVRFYAPDDTRLLSGRPAQGTVPADHALRDVAQADGLTQVLQTGLAEALCEALADGPAILHLTADLPLEWRDYPYEWLRYQGAFVQQRLVVARDVPRTAEGVAGVSARKGVILNLWPNENREPVQPAKGLTTRYSGLEMKKGHVRVDDFMARENLHDYGLLVVVAHGSEGTTPQPFRLEDDSGGWSLPTERGLPPLVILLACGSEDGNLIDYGRHLLAAGARAVLAPRGKLDAEKAGAFLRDFMESWWQNRLSLATALHLAQQADQTQRHGAARLCLLGEPGLGLDGSNEAAAFSLKTLADRVQSEVAAGEPTAALATWCERLTLHHYQRDGHLDDIGLKIEEAEEALLLKQLHPLLDALPLLTQSWVLPYVAYLAESHDHGLLDTLKTRRKKLEQGLPQHVSRPTYHYQWAKLDYRRGNYLLAARELVDGLELLQPPQYARQGIGLLGSLMNVLIDQNLPEPARYVGEQLDLALQAQSDEWGKRQRRNLIDRQARLDLRMGKPVAAHTAYHRRWQQSERPDQRALIWLLYLAAWHPVAQERTYLDAIVAAFDAEELPSGRLGNDPDIYRLRAMAAWAWCRNDKAVAQRVALAIPFCCHQILDQPQQDAGPVGFILAYLHLYAMHHQPAWQFSLPDWASIGVALLEHRYFLEWAAFSALKGEQAECKQVLSRYQNQRRPIVEALGGLSCGWLSLDWNQVLKTQEARENTILLASEPPPAHSLLEQGLLPL